MTPLRIGIAGFGAIGQALARSLDAGIDGLTLAAIGLRDAAKVAATPWRGQAPRATSIDALEPHCDVVVECAPGHLLPAIASPVLKAGKKVVVLSAGAILSHPELPELARRHGGQILVPSGALIGLDAMVAAAEGTIRSVRMITRKPVRGLLGAPFLKANNIDIEHITEPMMLFRGSPREAVVGFPANLNVAVSLSLAGIGPDLTELEIWADPSIERNTHRMEVDADAASFSMEIRNVPSENPKTGKITAQSAIALLRKMTAPVAIGT